MSFKYRLLKHITVLLQVFNIPFSVYAGAMLAFDNKRMFFLGLSISMVFTFLQAHIWWMTMEYLKTEDKK